MPPAQPTEDNDLSAGQIMGIVIGTLFMVSLIVALVLVHKGYIQTPKFLQQTTQFEHNRI